MGGTVNRRVAAKAIVLAMLAASLAWMDSAIAAEGDNIFSSEKGLLFLSENDISGNGYYTGYSYMSMLSPHSDSRVPKVASKLEISKQEHGSGTMENEWTFNADDIGFDIQDDDSRLLYESTSLDLKESGSSIYSPQTLAIGRGYYANHPIIFASTLGKKAEVKNRATEGSITRQISYARSIREDLSLEAADSLMSFDGDGKYHDAEVSMNVDEDVAEGITHIGALQGNTVDKWWNDPGASAWKNANVEIDQVFIGDHFLTTKIDIPWHVKQATTAVGWLECCYGGWNSMLPFDHKGFGKSTQGIFDCTCYTAP